MKLSNGWYRQFEFYKSVITANQLPDDNGIEVAFAGRSNVGKSSVINKITNRRSLARTSKLPGRTRGLNYFAYSNDTYLVDMPGYGYAKVNMSVQNAWTKLMKYYLQERTSLKGVFLIMDIRHPMRAFDQMMLDYCRSRDLSLHVILNKADKLSRSAGMGTMFEVQKRLTAIQVTCQLFSAVAGTGLEETRIQLEEWLFNS